MFDVQSVHRSGHVEFHTRVRGSVFKGSAFKNEPQLLILDEPTAGMSPEETGLSLALLRRLCTDHGLTVLFCEHDMGMVFSFAHEIMVMQQGQTIVQSTPAEVRNDSRVQAAYLGGADKCSA